MDENPGIIYTDETSEQEEEVVNIQPQNDAIPPENLIELLQFDRNAEKFVCISELREKYLTGLCRATFYSKLRRLGVSPVRATEEEVGLLRKRLKSCHGTLNLMPKHIAFSLLNESRKRKYPANELIDKHDATKGEKKGKIHVEQEWSIMDNSMHHKNSQPFEIEIHDTGKRDCYSHDQNHTDKVTITSNTKPHPLADKSSCSSLDMKKTTSYGTENEADYRCENHNSLFDNSEYHQGNLQSCPMGGENVSEEESCSNNQNRTVDALALSDGKKDQLTVGSEFVSCDKGSECQTTKHPRDTKVGAERIENMQIASTQTQRGKSKRTRKTIDQHDLMPRVQADLSKFRTYWKKAIVADRTSPPLANSTMAKIIERVSQFFWYCKNVKQLIPTFELVEDIALVEQFVDFLQADSKRSMGTVALIIQALIHVAKFNNRSNFFNFDEIPSIRKLRNIQAGLLRLYERGRKMANPNQTKGKIKLFWTEILDIVRKLINTYESFDGNKVEEGRLLHDITLTLMLVSASPNRNIDYMKLILVDRRFDDDDKMNDEFMPENQCDANYLILTFDGQVIIRDYVYKTAKDYGSSDLPITDIEYLKEYLFLFIDKGRQRIMMDNTHDFLFMKTNGEPFNLSSEFSYYLGCVFGRYGRRLTTVDLRRSLVTFVLEHEEANEELRKSLASLMKHSVRHQENTYCIKNFGERKSAALKFLSESTGKYLGFINHNDENGTKEEDCSIELYPDPGNIVALVAADSTERFPKIFLAKLLQYKDKGTTAVLGELELTEGSSKCYRLKPGSCWTESTKALVWPIDTAYVEKGEYYRLRTSLKDIHKSVKTS